tara:strand:+ start:531 stop:737 length:207 start_codon:yes stop_codon:yes gene_type:complete
VIDSNIMTSDKQLRDEMRRAVVKVLSDMREKLSKENYTNDYFKGMELAEGIAVMVIDGCQLPAIEVEA